MLSESERLRFNSLRNRKALGETLSLEETAEVLALKRRLEDAERVYLDPATARLRAQNMAADERINGLMVLIERKEQRLLLLRSTLAGIQAKHNAEA